MEKIISVDRRNTDCNKWDNLEERFGAKDLLPLWVADMDFKASKCILDALEKTIDHGVFGYYKIPDSYYNAFIQWEKKYHSYEVKKEWIRFAPGVVPAVNWLIQMLTKGGDAVIVQTPVYYPFLNAVNNNGRKLIQSDLVNNGGVYTIDFEKFENDIKENGVKMFILCTPHNPAGRVWTKEELTTLLEICKRNEVFVISDEIHHDLILGDKKHIPTATVGDYSNMMVTVTAATKTFNLAGCQNSFVIISDEKVRKIFDEYTNTIQVTSGNTFGYVAVEAAYREGRPWFEEVLKIIKGNYEYIKATCEKELPKVVISPLEGTYLTWMDFSEYVKPGGMKEFIQDKCKIAIDFGSWFGGSNFESFIRINLATSRENIIEAMDRIIREI